MISSFKESKSNKLPHLRPGLTYTFNDYDYDGKPQWLIHDYGRNKFFIIGWSDYEMLIRWHLGTVQAIVDAVNKETTLQIEPTDVEALIQFLAHNFLIELSGNKVYQAAKDQNLYKDDNVFSWLISHYLFFRIPIWHPDKFLTKTKKFGQFLFSRRLAMVMCFLAIVALYQISTKWPEFVSTFPSVISWRGLFFYFIAFTVVKIMHEAGHAYKCKEYGIPVPSCGLAFLIFWPVLYTDTTLSWTLNNKQRLRIALAGIQVETYVTIIAALIWCNTDNLTLQTICYVTITINWLSSLLINVSPFMRFDGYYVLADFLKMPNLQYRSFALARWQLRKWLFGWQDQPPEHFSRKMHIILVVYAFTTWLYRLSLYLGIALLVYYMFFKALGIILFIVEIYYFVLDPFIKEFKVWLRSKEKFRLNINTIITLTATVFLLGFFFIPFQDSIKIPATMQFKHQFIVAPEEGFMANAMPEAGTKVVANQPIAQIESPALNYAIYSAQLEYEKLQSEVRRSSFDETYAKNKNALLSDIDKKKSEYAKLMDESKKLTLSVSFDGVIIDSASELSQGSYVRKNEWLADVVNPNIVSVEAYVEQIDLTLLKNSSSGEFYPEDFSEKKVPVKLVLIEPLNPTQLSCQYAAKTRSKESRVIIETPCYNSNVFGGQIATYVTDKGEYVPVKSVYRAIFSTDATVHILQIQRGYVVAKTTPRSYAYRVFYKIKSFLVEEKAF